MSTDSYSYDKPEDEIEFFGEVRLNIFKRCLARSLELSLGNGL